MLRFHSISVVFSLFAFWLLLSGYFTPFLMTLGLLSSVAVVWFARRMDVVDQEGHPLHLGRGVMGYWPWLIVEIVKSAWTVSKLIVHPHLPISPTMLRVKMSQQSPVGQVVYANSITLTPGTISVAIEEDEILVHALTRAGADDLAGGDMDRRVTACEARS
ncbi:Na+/H+ antiporter subunit E [Denitromonas iodatirespirans]|uniref:Na+/H+ antiporter subunit E n=1 Tax=Denitromonas iodatirespirans TaxID=2795389 RepID=A0A944DP22_DENI1|nr:Na+/H+ antiporter subunit E [Denitromonas iodatirespirans]MBT0962089.1 Na+/H+ antiporter subunit E [Denitromonas iodatirespirans]